MKIHESLQSELDRLYPDGRFKHLSVENIIEACKVTALLEVAEAIRKLAEAVERGRYK